MINRDGLSGSAVGIDPVQIRKCEGIGKPLLLGEAQNPERCRGRRRHGGGRHGALIVCRWRHVELLDAGELDALADLGADFAQRSLNVAGNGKLAGRRDGHRAGSLAVHHRQVLGHDRSRLRSQRVGGQRSFDDGKLGVTVQKERPGDLEVVGVVEDLYPNAVRLAVIEDARKRGQIHPVRHEVQGLDAGNGTPQIRVNAAGVNPRVDRRNSGRAAVYGDLGFAERRAAVVFQRGLERVGHAQVPELVTSLALRDQIQIRADRVGRKSECLRKHVTGAVQCPRAAGRVRQRQDHVRHLGGRRSWPRRVELQVRAAADNACVGRVDQIA